MCNEGKIRKSLELPRILTFFTQSHYIDLLLVFSILIPIKTELNLDNSVTVSGNLK